MARYTGPKWKLSRREGMDLFGRPGSKFQRTGRTSQAPGVHGPKQFRGKMSSFGLHLREKQKARRIYGVLERQFKGYYQQARKIEGNTADNLARLLEMRLDNVIYRLGFTTTRAQARQLVNHSHVLVNGKKVNIPSFIVAVNDVVSLKPKSAKLNLVMENLQAKHSIPSWLSHKSTVGKINSLPKEEDLDIGVKYNLIIEYYSR
jgi:small subunit ribosomal protein S4